MQPGKNTMTINQMTFPISVFCPLFTFVYIFINHPSFLFSQSGYINGSLINQHYIEASLLKDFLKNQTTNFWHSYNGLGYPLLLISQPLPTFISAIFMLVFDWIASPLFIFRLVLLVFLSITPIVWYKGLAGLNHSKTESLLAGLFLLHTTSQYQNGIEIHAYSEEGLSQFYALLILPFSVASILSSRTSQKESKAVYFMCLVYMCHAFSGLFCSIISVFGCIVNGIVLTELTKQFKTFIVLHLKICLYLSWWIVPYLISYPYIGGSTVKQYGELDFLQLCDVFVKGKFFYHGSRIPWISILASIGFFICIIQCASYKIKHFASTTNVGDHETVRSQYIQNLCLISVATASSLLYVKNPLVDFFLNIMPFDFTFTNKPFIIGLHFIGILFAAKALNWIIETFSELSIRYKGSIKSAGIILISLALMTFGAEKISTNLSIVEASDEFLEALRQFKVQNKGDGRILMHESLGTGDSWDMSNIPVLSGKPGALSYSRDWHDNLSTFYLDSLPLQTVPLEELLPMFRLYNIKYLVISVEDNWSDLSSLKHLFTVDELAFYEIIQVVDEEFAEYIPSSYFDFVHLPGNIDGKLMSMRETVLESLPLYRQNVLLYLNPRQSSQVRKKGILNVQVMDIFSGQSRSVRKNDVSLVTWKLNGQGTSSEEALSQLEVMFEEMEIRSKVIETKIIGLDYHAIVDVAQISKNDSLFTQMEHLLFKVSFHPFWRCIYFPVSEKHSLATSLSKEFKVPRRRFFVPVDHVSPNLISVTLPAGRYHVVFRYRVPGILKMLAIISMLVFVNNALKLSLFSKTIIFLSCTWEFYETRMLCRLICLFTSLIHEIPTTNNVKNGIRRLSEVTFNTVDVKKRKYLRNWISQILVSCKQSLINISLVIRYNNSKNLTSESADGLSDDTKLRNDDRNKILVKKDMFSDCKDDVFSSECDSSFMSEALVYRSPPTPPKHTKRSYRKKHARPLSQESASEGDQSSRSTGPKAVFQTSPRKSTSPVLGSILESLRNNSLSPTPKSVSPAKEELSPVPVREMVSDIESSPRMETIVPEPLYFFNNMMSFSASKLTSSPTSLSKVTSSSTTFNDELSRSNFEVNDIHEKKAFLPSTETKATAYDDKVSNSAGKKSNTNQDYKQGNEEVAPKTREFTSTQEPREVATPEKLSELLGFKNNSFESSGGEWDDLICNSYDDFDAGKSKNIKINKNGGDTNNVGIDIFKDDDTAIHNEIDIDRLVSRDADGNNCDGAVDFMDSLELSLEDSFSPRSSSSPEQSLSSPERFSSSPDGHSSPDNSFEFTSYGTPSSAASINKNNKSSSKEKSNKNANLNNNTERDDKKNKNYSDEIHNAEKINDDDTRNNKEDKGAENNSKIKDNKETVIKSEMYRIYLPESPRSHNNNNNNNNDGDGKKRRRRTYQFDPIEDEISRLQRLKPRRRVTIHGKAYEEDDGEDSNTSPLAQLRKPQN